MLAGLALLVVAVMKLFPELPLSRLLHHHLVEAPMRALGTMRRRHLIYVLVLVVMSLSAGELVLLLGSADVVMLMAWDASLYVDALIAAWTMSALLRGKAVWRALVARVPRLKAARPRTPRRRRKEERKPANDTDEDGRDDALAA